MDSPDPDVRNGVARDIVFLEAVEINPVVVHGGGKAITRAMEKAGLKANFIQGQRVTDEATVQIVDDVLSREINPEVVATINSLGGLARGLPARTFSAAASSGSTTRRTRTAKIDLGYVGEVIGVNTAPLLECIWQGHHAGHQPHRARRGRQDLQLQRRRGRRAGRHRAQGQAPRLHERRARPDAQTPKTRTRHLRTCKSSEVAGLKQRGIVDKGMIPKVDSAVAAIKAGVEKVSFVDGRVPHAVLLEIFTDEGVGTEVSA